MKADWTTKLLLLLIALGLWANVLSHPRGVRASGSSDCSAAESAARSAYSEAEDAKKEIHQLRCGTTDVYGNVTVTDLGNSRCLTLPDIQSNIQSHVDAKISSVESSIKYKIDLMPR
jgi:hypothetical protein